MALPAAAMPTVVGRHDQLEVRVLVDQRQRLVVGLVGVVVAVDGVDELEVGVLLVLERGLHRVDPGVLVGGVRGGRQDGELAALVAQDVERHVGHDHAGLVEVDLGDEQALALARRDRRVPAHDLDVRRRWRRRRPTRSARRRCSRSSPRRRPGWRRWSRSRSGRSRSSHVDGPRNSGSSVPSSCGRLLGALVGLVEHRDARALRQQDRRHGVAALDVDGLAGGRAPAGRPLVRRARVVVVVAARGR